jgi:hypothetical protein
LVVEKLLKGVNRTEETIELAKREANVDARSVRLVDAELI